MFLKSQNNYMIIQRGYACQSIKLQSEKGKHFAIRAINRRSEEVDTEILLNHIVKQLRMPTIGKQYRSIAWEAEERNLSYKQFLLVLLEAE